MISVGDDPKRGEPAGQEAASEPEDAGAGRFERDGPLGDEPASLGRCEVEMAKLDAEYDRIGERALAIDERRAELKKLTRTLRPR